MRPCRLLSIGDPQFLSPFRQPDVYVIDPVHESSTPPDTPMCQYGKSLYRTLPHVLSRVTHSLDHPLPIVFEPSSWGIDPCYVPAGLSPEEIYCGLLLPDPPHATCAADQAYRGRLPLCSVAEDNHFAAPVYFVSIET